MGKYHDREWLDNLGRQYEIAMAAHCDLEDVVAKDFSRRTGASVERVLHALNLTDDPDALKLTEVNRSWFEEIIAVKEQIRSLLGRDFEPLRARLDLMYDVVNGCGAELARHLGGESERYNEMLSAYAGDHKDGYSEGFAAWLEKTDAENEQTKSKINAAAELNDFDEAARLLFIKPQHAIRMLVAYRTAMSSEPFADWAWRHLETIDAAAE